jgi:Ser/Thr protein kinase RdoA (MazF antagonist)
VKTGDASFILKWYWNTGMADRVRFEHELLNMPASAGLPFTVPSPLPTSGGATSVEITRDEETSCLALFHCIPGRAAVYGNEAEAYQCGEALAVLDDSLDLLALDSAVPIVETFGDLSSIHPSIPQPVPAIHRVFEGAPAPALANILSSVEEQWQRHTSGWRPQLIHGDFYPTNTLFELGEVSGVLDFEFSGSGYRAMDFSIGLAAFSTKSWDTGCSWPLMESFATGYLQRSPLAEDALSAMPVLLLMREANSFIHWLGRMKQGLTTLDDIHARARRLLSLYHWLEAHQTELVDRLLRLNGR